MRCVSSSISFRAPHWLPAHGVCFGLHLRLFGYYDPTSTGDKRGFFLIRQNHFPLLAAQTRKIDNESFNAFYNRKSRYETCFSKTSEASFSRPKNVRLVQNYTTDWSWPIVPELVSLFVRESSKIAYWNSGS